MSMSLEDTLKQEAATLERALAKNPDFQRLTIVRKFLMELQNIKTTPASMQFDFKAQNTPYYRSATSIVQGAEFAIEDAGVPCTTRELLEVLPKYGKVPGGINPATNLSNNLSSDFRFRSVMYRGNSAWWLVKMGDPPA